MADTSFAITAGAGTLLHTTTTSIGGSTVHDQVVKVGPAYLAAYGIKTTSTSAATADSHVLQIMAGASLNVYIRRIKVFQFAAATTAAMGAFDLVRLTTAGTGGTSFTPAPFDTTDAASGATAMTLPTAKGTEGTTLDGETNYFLQTISASLGVGVRSLVADFDYRDTGAKMPRIAAGTANGVCVKNRVAIAAATVVVVAQIIEANF